LRLLAALLFCVSLAGCLTPTPPAEPRYFTPGTSHSTDDEAGVTGVTGSGPQLRVRHVRAAAYLRDRMVWRRGVEIGFYDLLRWTEAPSRYAQSALEDELFERRGFRRSSTFPVTTLDATLESFDELLAPAHEALVSLDVVLSDPKGVTLLERSFEARKPIAGDDPKAVADALGEALSEASRLVGEAVSAALSEHHF
jgi:ABC-type uncharacterized transport system auxiliary subunit